MSRHMGTRTLTVAWVAALPGRKRLVLITLLLVFSVSKPANATVGFQPPVSYPVGTGPAAVAVADFNGDGTPDLAVANSSSGDVSILLGNGDGTFQAAVNFNAAMPNPEALATGDFNQDGKADLAVFAPGVLSLLLGQGDGSFQTAKTLALTSTTAKIASADFNLDKKVDLAVSGSDPSIGNESIDIFLGKGDGTFQSAKQTSVGAGDPLGNASFAAADVDGDGKPDLVVSGYHSINIFLGNGDGTFGQGTSFNVPDALLPNNPIYPIGTLYASFSITDLRTADINGDGRADLVVFAEGFGKVCQSGACIGAKDRSEAVSLYLGNGDGSFQGEQTIAAAVRLLGGDGQLHGSQIVGMLLGDFDGDGAIDVVDRRCDSGCTLEAWLGLGNGAFAPALALPDGGPLQLAQDLNGDQLTDLVVLDISAANTIDVLLNTTPAFSMTGSALTLTVSPGQQVTDTLTIAGHNGFSSAIHLSCQVTGPAPQPACSLSPADITAGATSTTSLLTISAPANSAGLVTPGSGSLFPLVCALAVPFALLALGRQPKCPVSTCRRWLQATSLATAALVYGACAGCSNVGDPPVHQSKCYSVSVTATSSTITKTLQISLTIP
jgi:hypothetical protein